MVSDVHLVVHLTVALDAPKLKRILTTANVDLHVTAHDDWPRAGRRDAFAGSTASSAMKASMS